jgi:hypothetical protein
MGHVRFFVSYSHTDEDLAYQVRDVCKRHGVDCYIYKQDQTFGKKISESVARALDEASHVLLILSPASAKAPWVWYEAGRAAQSKKRILPYLAHPSVDVPGPLHDIEHVDNLSELGLYIEKLKPFIEERINDITRQLSSIPSYIRSLPIHDEARRALKYAVNAILIEHYKSLSRVEKGEIIAHPPEIYRVYAHFMDAVTEGFRAITVEDLDYWTTADSREYLEQNQKLIERGCLVERMFVLPYSPHQPGPFAETLPNVKAAIEKQVRIGIKVLIVFRDDCAHMATRGDIRSLDFGLFDDFAVSFFRLEEGRSYEITMEAATCHQRRDMYERMRSVHCQDVPGKLGPNKKVFENTKEFEAWLASVEPLADGQVV